MGQRTTKIVQAAAFEIADNALTRASVELAGFEPATSSLRKMWSKQSDQGKRIPLMFLWRGCGASDVRRREIWQPTATSSARSQILVNRALTPQNSPA